MRQIITWLGLSALCLLFGAAAIGLNQSYIAEDLSRRSQVALKELGQDWAQVSISGRDARLSGAAPHAEAVKEAVSAVERVSGVRLVDNVTTIAPPKPPVAAVPLFEVVRVGTQVALSGTVADENARQKLVQTIKSISPDLVVSDRLTLASGLGDSFSAHALFMATEAVKLDPVSAQIKGNSLNIQGKSGHLLSLTGLSVVCVNRLPVLS